MSQEEKVQGEEQAHKRQKGGVAASPAKFGKGYKAAGKTAQQHGLLDAPCPVHAFHECESQKIAQGAVAVETRPWNKTT